MVTTPEPAKSSVKKKIIPSVIAMVIAATVALEGGWVNNPNDPGGETNKGVTKAVAVANGYTGPMKTIPLDVVNSIYYEQYVVKVGYAPMADIDVPVLSELFDTTVNMGPARPGKWFQSGINSLCGVKIAVDGQVGPGTIGAYKTCQVKLGATKLCVSMLNHLDNNQLEEYKRLVRVNKKLSIFYKGWTAHRINNVDRKKCAVASTK